MKRLAILILCILPLHLSAQRGINGRIKKILGNEKLFSGVVLVAQEGKIIYHQAFGYRDFNAKKALMKNDIFELASLSKQFTAGIIMMLEQEGKLRYDDPVEKYLSIPYEGIKIRHLLNHTSGLPDYQAIMDKYWDKSKVAGNDDILDYLKRYAPPAEFDPGQKFEYSNTGYVLLASIAEKAGGEDFIEMCRSRIFSPLSMTDTDIRTADQKKKIEKFAWGHILVNSTKRFVRTDSFPSSDYTIWLGNRKGPGRISSSALDLLKWDQSLYMEMPFKRETLRSAWTSATLNDGNLSSYGFGWMLKKTKNGESVIWHSGDNPGYSTRIMRYPNSKRTLIVLCNNAYPEFESMMSKLEDVVEN